MRSDEIAIAVVGAHLSGMALNGELKAIGGRLLEGGRTAPDYKLFPLATTPPKPSAPAMANAIAGFLALLVSILLNLVAPFFEPPMAPKV